MQTLFTIHAGEYLVGSFIEKRFPDCRVWIPSKDSGIDLLITDKTHTRSLSLQVKFSKDFMPTLGSFLDTDELKVLTWFKFSAKALSTSQADYWVLVAHSYACTTPIFLVIPPKRLFEQAIKHHSNTKSLNLYFAINSLDQCWEIRGLSKDDKTRMLDGTLKTHSRNFTKYVNNWAPIQRI